MIDLMLCGFCSLAFRDACFNRMNAALARLKYARKSKTYARHPRGCPSQMDRGRRGKALHSGPEDREGGGLWSAISPLLPDGSWLATSSVAFNKHSVVRNPFRHGTTLSRGIFRGRIIM